MTSHEKPLPSAPSPAEETASEWVFSNDGKLVDLPHLLDCDCGEGNCRQPQPEPVSPSGGNVIHVPRIPGTVNTPVGPMILGPEAAAADRTNEKYVDDLMNYVWITNATLLHNPEKMAEIIERIRNEAINSVEYIRCMAHRGGPAYNHNAFGAECGECAVQSATPIAPAAEELIQELREALQYACETLNTYDPVEGFTRWEPENLLAGARLKLRNSTRAEEYRKGAKNG